MVTSQLEATNGDVNWLHDVTTLRVRNNIDQLFIIKF
jgi:hypothetical protein